MRKSVSASWTNIRLAEGSYTSGVNHGTFLHIAHEEGLIRNTSMHAGVSKPATLPSYLYSHLRDSSADDAPQR
jgi:hypothetical protein